MADDDTKLISRANSIAAGLRYYFTGKPCPKGHIAKRFVSSRACSACEAERADKKELQQREYRKRPEIKQAKAEYNRQYHAARRGKITEEERVRQRAATKRWRLNNLEKARELDRQYAFKARDRRREYGKRYQALYPERAATKERNKRALKRLNGGKHTVADVEQILKAQRNRCGCCRIKLGKKYHVDHIIPIARGGSNDRRNLQILCAPCNHSKYSRDPIEFMQSLGRLL